MIGLRILIELFSKLCLTFFHSGCKRDLFFHLKIFELYKLYKKSNLIQANIIQELITEKFQLTVFQIQSYMIEWELQGKSQNIKCGNCSQIMSKTFIYGCCYMLVCQQCFNRLHYLACNSINSKNQEVLNFQFTKQPIGMTRNDICQCCQDLKANKYCNNCRKYLCNLCSNNIHSKGKYLLHQRSVLNLFQPNDRHSQQNPFKKAQDQIFNICTLHNKPKNFIIDKLIGCKDCQASLQNNQNKSCTPISFQKINFQIVQQKLKMSINKSKEKQVCQLLTLKTLQQKLKQQYQKICENLKQKFQANQRLLSQNKIGIQKQISQKLALLSKRFIEIQSIKTMLNTQKLSQKNSNLLKIRFNYLKQMNLKTQKSFNDYPLYTLQLKHNHISQSLNQLIKNFAIHRHKNNFDDAANHKQQGTTNMRASQNCTSMKGSRTLSRLSANRLNSVAGKSVSKFKNNEQRQRETTGKKSTFSCNFNQKSQMCQSYKVNLKKQFQKQKMSKRDQIKEHKRNRSNSFAQQLNEIQKTQHQQFKLDLNRLTKHNSLKIQQDQNQRVQFRNNVFQNSKDRTHPSQKKQNQPRSNKFLQNSSENQNKSNNSLEKKKNTNQTIKNMHIPSINKLSIKKQLFQDKSKPIQIKTKSSRDSNSTNRRKQTNQGVERQSSKNVNQSGSNVTDFQQMSKEIDKQFKNKPQQKHIFEPIQNVNRRKHYLEVPMTRSIKIQHKENQKIQNKQVEGNKRDGDIKLQSESMKQNCCLPIDLLKQNKNKNSSFALKPKKKSDLLDMRQMMRKPNLVARSNIADKNIKNK